MKTSLNPLESKILSFISKFHKVNENERKEYIQKTIMDMHQVCTEAITRFVIMNKIDSFEAKKFIEYYYKICDIQDNFIKSGKIETMEFVRFKHELKENYERFFGKIM